MSRLGLVCVGLAAASCLPRPGLSEVTEADLPELGKRLPAGFWWGAGTAGTQIEGSLTNDWLEWETQGLRPDGGPRIKNGDSMAVAADSWNPARFDEDVAALEALGANMYRFSIEWSRIEPQEGQWDDAALAEYVRRIRLLTARGITPMVVLNHWAMPVWAYRRGWPEGGWEHPDMVASFERYVRRVVPALAADVDWYLTLNEPNTFAPWGYVIGDRPPGVRDRTDRAAKVMATQLEAHARAVAAIRELDVVDADADGFATRVSLSHWADQVVPASHSVLDQFIAASYDDFLNTSLPRALTSGRVLISVPGTITIDREVPGLAGSVDFIALQYYRSVIIRADLGVAALSTQTARTGGQVNDLDWGVNPDGLYEFLMRFAAYGLPIVVTENGIADAARTSRNRFIAQHVAAMERAIADGADVRGYLHWSLIDNFEWDSGYSGKFGLFAVDFEGGDLTRRPTPAVDAFRQVGGNIP